MKPLFPALFRPALSLATLLAVLPTSATLADDTVPLIMAGDAEGTPPDSPSAHIDEPGEGSAFNGVASVYTHVDDNHYIGSSVALNNHWLLSAAHVFDINNDGQIDSGLTSSVIFNTGGEPQMFGTSRVFLPSLFTGFDNPRISYDLALIYFTDPLPDSLPYYSIYRSGLQLGDEICMVGYGSSGYGDVIVDDSAYTVDPDFFVRRIGYNIVDGFRTDIPGVEGLSYTCDFDDPSTVGQPDGSLGNDIESVSGPGDSGGPAFVWVGDEYQVAGIITFGSTVDGQAWGEFGTSSGGMNLGAYLDWIDTTMASVPEPSTVALYMGAVVFAVSTVRRRRWLRE